MLFNRETDYAVRVLKNLSTDRPTSISSFVEGEFISEAIAYKVSRKLDKAGIIYGVRGSSGGYVLSRPLTEITLYDVHQAIEPHSLVCDCLKQDVSCLFNTDRDTCALRTELLRIQENINTDYNYITVDLPSLERCTLEFEPLYDNVYIKNRNILYWKGKEWIKR